MTYRFFFRIVALFIPLMLAPMVSQAQSISFGADFFSRYIWRGYDFGDSFSIQPGLALSAGNFELGSWASYSISADGAAANEHDLYASFGFDLGSSASLAFTITDYYFPTGTEWSNFDGDGQGAHWIELMTSITLPESFPLSLTAAFMVHNDPDNSLYIEAGVPFSVSDVDMGFTLGLLPVESGFYGVEEASLVNLSLSASKDLQITDSFALPLSAAYTLN
ncbi:MAG: hypothetical protein OXF48_08505, partial [Bacteroidetes bacterium]|nr:hypothetical protein [Bacteroidota bacterium]